MDRYPYIEAEVRYALQEYAVNAVDVLARRMRLAFQDVDATKQALPRVVDIMGQELKWDPAERTRQTNMALKYVDEHMGSSVVRDPSVRVPMTDVTNLLRKFHELAPGGKGLPYPVLRKTLLTFQLGDASEAEIERLAKQLNSFHPNKEVNATEFLGIVAFLTKFKEQNDKKIADMKVKK